MSRRNVHVANLRIRIPRRLAGQATAIANGLGNEILRGIAESTRDMTGSKKIGAMEVTGLQEQVAAQVAQQLRKRID